MKRVFLSLLVMLAPSFAQNGQVIVGNYGVNYVLVTPSGSCNQNATMQEVLGPGTLYSCQSGTWATVGGGGGTGTVTSIATTAPITGGTITTTGTLACATCVVASSPGVGLAHFAGSTQTVTSSAVNLAADVTGQLPIGNVGSVGLSGTAPVTISAAGAIACATCTTNASALTSNAVVLGGGGQAAATNTAFTTNGTTTLTVGVAAGGNGILALAGNTSGTATFTAPAVAGTTTNGVTMTNVLLGPSGAVTTPTYSFSGAPTSGMWGGGSGAPVFTVAGVNEFIISTSIYRAKSGGVIGFSSGDPAVGSTDTGLSRLAAGVFGVGNGSNASKVGLMQSGMSVFVTSNFTTSGVGTALEAITGLSITVPALAANWTFHAHIAYSQAVGTAAVAFGIQAVTNNPTNCFATGEMFTAAGTVITGTLATLTTTTATNVVSGTPGATATNNVADLYGTCELGASANTIRILVSTATAADLVTVLRGSYFGFNP